MSCNFMSQRGQMDVFCSRLAIAMLYAWVSMFLMSCTLFTKHNELYGTTFHDTLADGSAGPAMVWIPPGSFAMGDHFGDGGVDERPVVSKKVSTPFALGVYEITRFQFRKFVQNTGYITDAEKGDGCYPFGGSSWKSTLIDQGENHPVVCVSWNDAMAYIHWLSQQTGFVYHLPTEVQWEYAARAGSQGRFHWGDEILLDRMVCWFCTTTMNLPTTAIVGSYDANAFGLFDMQGNVWEWTGSEWQSHYEDEGAEEKFSRLGMTEGSRVMRSGSWYNNYLDARVSNRGYQAPDSRYNNLGFRVARLFKDKAGD